MFKKITNLFKGKNDKQKGEELKNEASLEEDLKTIEKEAEENIDQLKKEVKEDLQEHKEDKKKDEEKEDNLEKVKEMTETTEDTLEDVTDKIDKLDKKLSETVELVEEKTEQANEKLDEVAIPAEVYNEEMDFDSHKEEVIEQKEGFFKRLKSGLAKTRQGITEKVDLVLSNFTKIDEELFEELEEVLIMADVGMETTMKIIEAVKQQVKLKKITQVGDIKGLLKEEMKKVLLEAGDTSLNIEPSPAIVLVVGVNGAGKTTTIGKLSSRLKN